MTARRAIPGTALWRAGGVAVAFSLLAGVAAGHPGIVQVDPVGQPPGVALRAERPTYYLWYEDGVWHLRTKTREKRHAFSGTIVVRGGRVARLAAASLERKRGNNDVGRVGRGGTRIDFRTLTMGGVDGFDFVVAGEGATVEFDLRIDGTALPSRVEIGFGGAAAPAARFMFPANPGAVGG